MMAMKRNPQASWTIDDVAFLCRGLGIGFTESPRTGSHCVVSHPRVEGLLTIPARRAIKPMYIMLLVQLVERVLDLK